MYNTRIGLAMASKFHSLSLTTCLVPFNRLTDCRAFPFIQYSHHTVYFSCSPSAKLWTIALRHHAKAIGSPPTPGGWCNSQIPPQCLPPCTIPDINCLGLDSWEKETGLHAGALFRGVHQRSTPRSGEERLGRGRGWPVMQQRRQLIPWGARKQQLETPFKNVPDWEQGASSLYLHFNQFWTWSPLRAGV